MAAIPHVLSIPSGQTVAASRFLNIGASGQMDQFSSEASSKVRWRSAGTCSKAFIQVTTNGRTGAGTMVFRKNGANGNQSVSITGLTTGHFEDASNSDSISAGDDLDFQVNPGAGGTTMIFSAAGCLFAATSNSITRYLTRAAALAIGNNQLWPLAGAKESTGVEANAQDILRTAGTLKNGATLISSNTRNGTCTLTLRLNGADTALAISVTAATSGVFEDTSNTVTIADGDLVCWKSTQGGTTGNCIQEWLAVDFETTNSKSEFFGWNGANVGANLTRYLPTEGGNTGGWVATESSVQHRVQAAQTTTRLHVFVSTNNVNGSSTYSLRLNGGNGNQSTSIGSSTTGRFEDVTNSDAVVATDLLAVQMVTGGTTGTLTVRTFGLLWGNYAASAGPTFAVLVSP